MKILETSKEYALRKSKEVNRNKCPECGCEFNLGVYHVETKGFFNMKIRHINIVRCYKCGCQYEYADDWK